LGFSAGNEVALSAATHLGNLPCEKKFLRDMRAYVKDCVAAGGMRHFLIGVIFADHERELNAKYYNCRSDPDDELENAEFVGINAYLHCDGTATHIDELIGYKTLLAGVASWGMTIPVMWTEFGCLNPSFEQLGEYEAQRNFLQVDALFSPEYREHFNGGFVFEYSTEKVYSQNTSPYPFTSFGNGNYGVGYFSPEDCDGMDIPCEYNPFPQFQSLAARYAAVDASDEPTLDNYNPPVRDPPTCPDGIPSLSAFDWATNFDIASTTRTRQCPVMVPVYCVGVPAECVTISHPGAEDTILVATPFPTTVATAAPAPTQGPSISNSSAPISIGASSVITPSNTSNSDSAAPGSTVESSTATPTANLSSETAPTTSPPPASSLRPSSSPTGTRTSAAPTEAATVASSHGPSDVPSQVPSSAPSLQRSREPSDQPTLTPSSLPTTEQSVSTSPTLPVSSNPTASPSDYPQISIDLTGDNNRATSSAVSLLVGKFGFVLLTSFALTYIQR
jgi:Glucanosyltransferase